MSPTKTSVGVLPVVMALIAAVSTTFAVVEGTLLRNEIARDDRIRILETSNAVVITDIKAIKESQVRIETLLNSHIDKAGGR